MITYGKELILDLHGCNPGRFTRDSIASFLASLCEIIDMEKCDLHFWDYEGYADEYKMAPNHLKGITAVQFISTSNITIHTLDALQKVFLNIFSCKDFDTSVAASFSEKYFEGKIVLRRIIERT